MGAYTHVSLTAAPSYGLAMIGNFTHPWAYVINFHSIPTGVTTVDAPGKVCTESIWWYAPQTWDRRHHHWS